MNAEPRLASRPPPTNRIPANGRQFKSVEALVGAALHTPDGLKADRALLMADGEIRDIVPAGAVPAGARVTSLAGGTLAAGFIDLQVNGGGGVMFNDAPSADTIAIIGRAHRARGTTGFLPTFVSGSRAGMARAVEAVRATLDAALPGVLGIHFEGPHINATRRGIHDGAALRPIGENDLDLLASLGTGRTLVTLAPECVAPGDIAALVSRGAIVAAGHTDADGATLDAAAARGLTRCHPFVSMPWGRSAIASRGAAGAALARDRLVCGVIADGVHVHWDAVRIAWRAKPPGYSLPDNRRDGAGRRAGPDDRIPARRQVVRVEDGCLRTPEGRLAGSLLDMGQAVRNLRDPCRRPAQGGARHGRRLPGGFPRPRRSVRTACSRPSGRISSGWIARSASARRGSAARGRMFGGPDKRAMRIGFDVGGTRLAANPDVIVLGGGPPETAAPPGSDAGSPTGFMGPVGAVQCSVGVFRNSSRVAESTRTS